MSIVSLLTHCKGLHMTDTYGTENWSLRYLYAPNTWNPSSVKLAGLVVNDLTIPYAWGPSSSSLPSSSTFIGIAAITWRPATWMLLQLDVLGRWPSMAKTVTLARVALESIWSTKQNRDKARFVIQMERKKKNVERNDQKWKKPRYLAHYASNSTTQETILEFRNWSCNICIVVSARHAFKYVSHCFNCIWKPIFGPIQLRFCSTCAQRTIIASEIPRKY